MSFSLFHYLCLYLSVSLSLSLPDFYLYFQFSHRTSIDTWHSSRARKKKKNHLRKDPPLFPFSFFLPTSLRPSERPDQIWRRWNLSSIADNSRHGRRDYDRWAGRNSRPLWSAALGLECWVKKKGTKKKRCSIPPPPTDWFSVDEVAEARRTSISSFSFSPSRYTFIDFERYFVVSLVTVAIKRRGNYLPRRSLNRILVRGFFHLLIRKI